MKDQPSMKEIRERNHTGHFAGPTYRSQLRDAILAQNEAEKLSQAERNKVKLKFGRNREAA